jgi:uncharacterized protein (DUF2252 family)
MRPETTDTVFESGKAPHTHDARTAHGRAARKAVPRPRHAELALEGRPDPVALLQEQERSRVPELVPVRHGRMMASPFSFFRGAALVMASDLARTPTTGLTAQLCGDAHLLNFGLFGTPERSLVFDVNDFDETLPGPWEWDLKRLAASLEIAGRSDGFSKHDRRGIVLEAARCYRQTMAELATKHNVEVWYARLDVEAFMSDFKKLLTHRQRKIGEKAIAKAHEQDSARALDKLTEVVGGTHRIISQPPLIVPLRDLVGAAAHAALESEVDRLTRSYVETLSNDRRALLEQYRFVELARKVVGVGSVGTRCWIALFVGANDDDPLFLQIKEAEPSVLERFTGRSAQDNHGERVVAGQRLMQAASDLLLGWARMPGADGVQRDYYVRQLRDWKGSLVVDDILPGGMSLYGRLCGWTLARAHARSGDRVAIASYLGRSDSFDEAIADFAEAYAELNERDHEALVRAIQSGRIAAEPGV